MEFAESAWKSFRNLEPCRRQWSSGVNILSGPNGSGKTNLLESFHVLCGWGPFAGKSAPLPAWGEPRAFLGARLTGEEELEVEVQVGPRTSLRVGKESVTHPVLRSFVPSLSFLPPDTGLLDGSPGARRFFLDKLCALCSPLYARRLAEYGQLVRQRTALLRQSGPPSPALRATAVPLAKLGGWIRDIRKKTVFQGHGPWTQLEDENERGREPCIPSEDRQSLDFWIRRQGRENFGLSFETGLSLSLKGSLGIEDAAEDLEAALAASREREAYAGTVLVGPHRDDLLFHCTVDGKSVPAALALSRGQKRRVVAAAILAAGRLIEKRLRRKPVLLLDDVTAELDAEGCGLLLCALAETGWQTFLTTADEARASFPGAASWKLRDGTVLGAEK
ncbi:MAG: DNA replication and repair protein RecF [Synergistaceae bacterium]|nr:DNA replication and repair protein RecF [Synergistaceae bacterium]